jgi:hypothetical protein
MENIDKATDPLVQKKDISMDPSLKKIPAAGTSAYTVFEKLSSEGYEELFRYIEFLGLLKYHNLIILPSSSHYYYDTDDLKDVKTLVNLKLLNKIKQVRDFLNTVYQMLPPESYLIGNFIDAQYQRGIFSTSNRKKNNEPGRADPFENGIESRIPFFNMIYDILDLRTNRFMTKKTVASLLKAEGLNISDMTDLEGITYFCAFKSST